LLGVAGWWDDWCSAWTSPIRPWLGGARVKERELDRQVEEQMLLLLHELKRGQGRLDLAAVIHPDAEMRLIKIDIR
jgi:hypothetical protein